MNYPFKKKRCAGSINQKLHLLLDAKLVKSRLGQHQIDKQLGPADGELKTHQAVCADLPDADKLACDVGRRGW